MGDDDDDDDDDDGPSRRVNTMSLRLQAPPRPSPFQKRSASGYSRGARRQCVIRDIAGTLRDRRRARTRIMTLPLPLVLLLLLVLRLLWGLMIVLLQWKGFCQNEEQKTHTFIC